MSKRGRSGRSGGRNGAALRPVIGRSTRFLRGGEAEARLQAAGYHEAGRGPEAVAATFLPGRLRKVKSKLLRRDGDRVVYASKQDEKPFERIEEFIGILDE
jgi:hypothetical protein